ncbi:MAG: serine/threonine protein kinase [Planctomycetes bacterium]|nr:serine/threonine protein kinase [Planctomycetota bacterium]
MNPSQAPPANSAQQLWQQWQASNALGVQELLAHAEELTLAQLVEVLRVDQHERWERGDPQSAEAYFARYPALQSDKECAVDLVYSEFLLREERGESPQVEEYLRRFPQFAVPLGRQLELRGGLAGSVFPASAITVTQAGDSSRVADDQTAGAAAGNQPSAGPPRYRAVRFHAKGGLGEVHVAEDTELCRSVALKRIQPSHADDPPSRARFLREAQITARLEHPGIVPVYGLVHDESDQPHYAMRFIQGESLRDAIQRFHSGDGPGRDAGERALAFRQLLGRFVAMCNTIAYAHSRGIVHRDIKPANIMLGKYGETLVVDWGLARPFQRSEAERATGEETLMPPLSPPASGGMAAPVDQTQPGQAMGTPAYMSPEQANGQWNQLGPASDIYSLGATLYELVSGQPPFQGDQVDVLARVRRGEFPPPQQLIRNVPAGLDAVCSKAMSLRPEARYRSATELAAEVDRWLADEPVGVYREPFSARAGRWMRRHRIVVTGLASLLLTTVVGLAFGLWAVDRERVRTARERDDKVKAWAAESKARQDEVSARKDEQNARELAMDALRSLTDDVVEQQMARRVQLTEDDREFLRKILERYETFAATHGASAESRSIRAEGYARVGVVRYRLGELVEAETAYRDALELYKRLAIDFPTRPESLELLKPLAAEFPTRPEFRWDLAQGHNNLGNVLRDTDRLAETEKSYRDALELYKQLAADFPADSAYHNELALTLVNLSLLLRDRRDFAEARQLLEEAEPHHQAALKANSREPTYRQSYCENLQVLAPTCAGLGDLVAAVRASEKLRDLGWDPANDAYNAACALALGVPAVTGNDQLDAEKCQDLAGQLTDRAMDMLRQAVERGFNDAAHIKKDTDLDPLRPRDDFQKLLAELEAK